jgi:hypothetical protein
MPTTATTTSTTASTDNETSTDANVAPSQPSPHVFALLVAACGAIQRAGVFVSLIYVFDCCC